GSSRGTSRRIADSDSRGGATGAPRGGGRGPTRAPAGRSVPSCRARSADSTADDGPRPSSRLRTSPRDWIPHRIDGTRQPSRLAQPADEGFARGHDGVMVVGRFRLREKLARPLADQPVRLRPAFLFPLLEGDVGKEAGEVRGLVALQGGRGHQEVALDLELLDGFVDSERRLVHREAFREESGLADDVVAVDGERGGERLGVEATPDEGREPDLAEDAREVAHPLRARGQE